MQQRYLRIGLALVAVCATGVAQARGFVITRASATVGSYTGEVVLTENARDQIEAFTGTRPNKSTSDSDTPLGLEAGIAWGIGLPNPKQAIVLDLGYEFLDADTFQRTDLLFTTAYRLGNFAPFIGYRVAEQDIDNSDGYDETGPFIGISFGGLSLGDSASIGFSLAYNDEVADFPDSGDLNGDGRVTTDAEKGEIDFSGFSAKALVSFRKLPLAAQLRYQRFSGDQRELGIEDFTEEYLFASLTWFFYKNSWK